LQTDREQDEKKLNISGHTTYCWTTVLLTAGLSRILP